MVGHWSALSKLYSEQSQPIHQRTVPGEWNCPGRSQLERDGDCECHTHGAPWRLLSRDSRWITDLGNIPGSRRWSSGTATNDIITTNTGLALIPKTPEDYVTSGREPRNKRALDIYLGCGESTDPLDSAAVYLTPLRELRFSTPGPSHQQDRFHWTGSAWVTAVNIRFAMMAGTHRGLKL